MTTAVALQTVLAFPRASPPPCLHARIVLSLPMRLAFHRHTWVAHFGHNLLHNLAPILETFHERSLTHLLSERRATFVALDLAPTGPAELPQNLLGMLFRRVISASELPTDEVHCFEHALLGPAHRHMLNMKVWATPSRAHRQLYASMAALLARAFCRGSQRPLCGDAPDGARNRRRSGQQRRRLARAPVPFQCGPAPSDERTSAVPGENSTSLHHSQIVNFESIFTPVTTADHLVAIALEIDRVTADVRSIECVNWPSVSHVINEDVVVPTA
jgi:hypothetical protein